jgi:hypothetical protein
MPSRSSTGPRNNPFDMIEAEESIFLGVPSLSGIGRHGAGSTVFGCGVRLRDAGVRINDRS